MKISTTIQQKKIHNSNNDNRIKKDTVQKSDSIKHIKAEATDNVALFEDITNKIGNFFNDDSPTNEYCAIEFTIRRNSSEKTDKITIYLKYTTQYLIGVKINDKIISASNEHNYMFNKSMLINTVSPAYPDFNENAIHVNSGFSINSYNTSVNLKEGSNHNHKDIFDWFIGIVESSKFLIINRLNSKFAKLDTINFTAFFGTLDESTTSELKQVITQIKQNYSKLCLIFSTEKDNINNKAMFIQKNSEAIITSLFGEGDLNHIYRYKKLLSTLIDTRVNASKFPLLVVY